MATCPPRQKLFETKGLSSLLFLCVSSLLWLVILGVFCPSSCELSLDPDFVNVNKFPEGDLHSRVSRGLLDFGGVKAKGKDETNLDAYDTLRQLSTAATQPFIRRRLFNTSVALTVPLFSFTLPQRAAEGSTVDLANQAIFGLFALLVVMLVFTVPVLFTGIRPFQLDGRSNQEDTSQNILNNLMNSEHLINLMGADMRNKIGLNPDECLQKSICDAHRHPKKYGLFALPFQIFFPPPALGKETSRSSKYQLAAQTGEYTKAECWARYNCFFDLLDLAVYTVDWFNPAYKDEMEANIQMV
ncbi:unnamed protein product [Orchesella dallaii]|uniref:Uncharacterized protein n=1 Tax=Orchesella dallaii TaxID=48710 RepID=A0ABP1Q700_9HEXA